MAVAIKPYSILLLCTKDPKDSTRNFSDLTNTLVKVSGCKINTEKLGFPCTNHKEAGKEDEGFFHS